MKIRLIASDLDGTLLTEQKEITPLSRRALLEAVRRGIVFVPATGRAFDSIPPEVLALPGAKYAITSNGAAIYQVESRRRIYQCLLTPESVDALLGIPRPGNAAIEVFRDGVPYCARKCLENPAAYGATGYGVEYMRRTRRPVEDIAAFARENRAALDSFDFLCGEPELRSRLRQQILEQVPDIYVTSSVSHLLEIGNCRAGKGNTLCRLLALLKISPEEAAAFGDADNDLGMLTAVGYGVAMGNADPHVRRAVSRGTLSNEEDGVARGIFMILSGCPELPGGELSDTAWESIP
ncbi:MAG: Cof-type HAD-IIB family hydrolase [Clostridiales bacterium]|nr:Cof-type HAD-IIB family hydrolase [Clostridiales bacterium]